MLKINVSNNFDQVLRRMAGFERQLPFATALALTRTAQAVKKAEQQRLPIDLDRPTPYTMRSLFLRRATKQDLEAEVWLKDDRAGSGTPAVNYLGPQIEGGPRGLKGFERRLLAAGIMRPGERAVPAAGAEIDGFGNMRRSQIVQILSQVKAFNTSGFNANATASKRSSRKRAAVQYFASGFERTTFGSARFGRGRVRQHLPRGIWLRRQTAFGSAVRPVLLFVKAVTYRKRFDFYGVADRTIAATFPSAFNDAADQALRTAWKR